MNRGDRLESYLSGKSELSRIYAAGKQELPPESLDEKIILAARQSADQISNLPRKNSLAWTLPVSLAAAVVLGASLMLFIHVSREHDQHSQSMPRVAIPSPIPFVVKQKTASIARTAQASPPNLPEPAQAENVELSSLQEHSSAEIVNADPRAPLDDEPNRNPELARRLSLPEPEWTVELMADPQAWLGHIELLVLKNRVAEAGTHLRAFTERHPKVALPEPLLFMMPDRAGSD